MSDTAITPPAVDSLHAEHVDLGRETARLKRLLDTDFEWKAIEKTLAEFAERVKRHFEFEEAGGYFQDVLEIAPHWHREVDRLYEEHARMRDELRQARHMVVDGDDRDGIRSFLHDWLALQQSHEANENRLILLAFNTDEGGGD